MAKTRYATKWAHRAALSGLTVVGTLTLAAAVEPEMKDGIVLPSIATSLPNNGDPSGIRKWRAIAVLSTA
jgi:hypothetical protein